MRLSGVIHRLQKIAACWRLSHTQENVQYVKLTKTLAPWWELFALSVVSAFAMQPWTSRTEDFGLFVLLTDRHELYVLECYRKQTNQKHLSILVFCSVWDQLAYSQVLGLRSKKCTESESKGTRHRCCKNHFRDYLQYLKILA